MGYPTWPPIYEMTWKEGNKEGVDPSHCLKWKTIEAGNMNLPGTDLALGLNQCIFKNIKQDFM